MDRNDYRQNRQKLTQLMDRVGIVNLKELSKISGVSEYQLSRFLYGLILQMPVQSLIKLAKPLKLSVTELLNIFTELDPEANNISYSQESSEIETWRQEYQRLQQQLDSQKETLNQEFQQSSLAILESLLLQLPTAIAAAQNNPQLPAVKILPLLKPIEQLLINWEIETIGNIGAEVPYNPTLHQLMEGTAAPEELVKIRYVGYRQGEKLLFRAKVSLIINKL
jgi:molecular chaperone GrpE (heat shock protein)